MSEMIERVAEAIANAYERDADFSAQARAAIAAMREPSEAMLKVGEYPQRYGRPEMTKRWQAMIDAALEE